MCDPEAEVTCFNMYALPVNRSLDFCSQIFNKLLLIESLFMHLLGIEIKLFVKTVLVQCNSEGSA